MDGGLEKKLKELGLDKQGVKTFSQKEAEANEIQPNKDQPLRLFTSKIAGTSHIHDAKKLFSSLQVGESLKLQRDKENEFDWNAVLVLTNDGEKLGFLPKSDNEIASKLLEGGKSLHAEILDIEIKAKWADISIAVYLDD